MSIEQIAQAVRARDAAEICGLLVEGSPPSVRQGAKTETELWDYKGDVPKTPVEWASIARHALAFHNNRGGVIIFGVRDRDFSYAGDSKVFNEKLRRFLGDTWLRQELGHTRLVAEHLGHADLSTVARYAHVDRDELFDAAGRLEQLADPEGPARPNPPVESRDPGAPPSDSNQSRRRPSPEAGSPLRRQAPEVGDSLIGPGARRAAERLSVRRIRYSKA